MLVNVLSKALECLLSLLFGARLFREVGPNPLHESFRFCFLLCGLKKDVQIEIGALLTWWHRAKSSPATRHVCL